MLKLKGYLKPYAWYIVISIAMLMAQAVGDLLLPNLMSKIVDVGIRLGGVAEGETVDFAALGMTAGQYQTAYIAKIGVQMLCISLLSGFAAVLVGYFSSFAATGVGRDLRGAVFKKVLSFSGAEYDRFSVASLITRSTNDVTQVQMLLAMGIRMMCFAPVMAIGGIVMALRKSVSLSWVIALAVVVLFGVILVIFTAVMPKFKMMQKLIDRLNLVARETLNGLMVIRAFGAEKLEKGRFESANKNLTKTTLFTSRAIVFLMPAMTLIMNGTSLLIIAVGSKLIAQSSMQVGDMMAFMQYAMHIIMSFLFISMMFIFIPRAAVSAARISEVLETQPAVTEPLKPLSIKESERGTVELQNVSFRYSPDAEDAVQDITFKVKRGQTAAFIGATGSGKSTIMNLIVRFYDATGGTVLVDGVDVRELSLKDLRSRIGYVPQKSVLMKGTIESNIKYGDRTLSDADMERAAKTAQAYEFIEEKEDRFASEIAQGGDNVSGGQKQRLAIARALAIKPDVYIFDDSFSALDFATDAALRKALASETKNSAVLIVAQRVSTIMNADAIYVIDEGKIVGSGTHEQLLKTCEEYREIASSQLSEEELGI